MITMNYELAVLNFWVHSSNQDLHSSISFDTWQSTRINLKIILQTLASVHVLVIFVPIEDILVLKPVHSFGPHCNATYCSAPSLKPEFHLNRCEHKHTRCMRETQISQKTWISTRCRCRAVKIGNATGVRSWQLVSCINDGVNEHMIF